MYLLISLMLINTCQIGAPEPNNRSRAVWSPDENFQKKVKAYFASGCFWCVAVSYTHLTLPTTPYV